MPRARDAWVNLARGQLTALAGLCTLRHLDLNLFCGGKIRPCHAESSGGDLLDGAVAVGKEPLCRLADDHDGWGDNFLAPILRSAGYRVLSGSEDADEAPDVLLCLTEDGASCTHSGEEIPVIRLRSAIAATGPDDETVYRYDRQALLDALARRVGGGRA